LHSRVLLSTLSTVFPSLHHGHIHIPHPSILLYPLDFVAHFDFFIAPLSFLLSATLRLLMPSLFHQESRLVLSITKRVVSYSPSPHLVFSIIKSRFVLSIIKSCLVLSIKSRLVLSIIKAVSCSPSSRVISYSHHQEPSCILQNFKSLCSAQSVPVFRSSTCHGKRKIEMALVPTVLQAGFSLHRTRQSPAA